jgi:hydroxymethylglutaryl-CoA lyase
MMKPVIQIIECPRDAMQGWTAFIPTQKKIEYINSLLKVGFHTIDFGSFVSPKAVPQMADTKEVIEGLDVVEGSAELLAIVANTRGAEEAVGWEKITYLGFPFSISPTFQQRNANSSIHESLGRVDEIQNLCVKHNKRLVLYLSMAFGNPYGDEYSENVLLHWASEMVNRDIAIISLADTIGVATADQIATAFSLLIPAYTNVQFGVHLHSTAENREQKVNAAYDAGCKRFDGALKGIGGCPFADDVLVGNLDTEWLLNFMDEKGERLSIDNEALKNSSQLAERIFV